MRSRNRDHPGQHGETPSLLKIQKISWAWWLAPVIPGTWEAEAGELPEPRRQRLQWTEIAPLHSRLGKKSKTLSQKKRKETVQTRWLKPVIPATQETEARESLETGKQRLLWAEIKASHSGLDNKSETPSQKKKNYPLDQYLGWENILLWTFFHMTFGNLHA